MNKNPNFFIIGAPKCGTTALSEYLKEHPNVFMSTPKEPHYFASEMVKHSAIKNSKDYFNLFEEVTEEHKAIGEASVWYLYSKEAVKNIYKFDKNAKIIIMLRKPVEMVYSMHSQHLYSGSENVHDFEKAWYLEKDRKKGNYIPRNILHVPNLYYSEIANYYTQLQNVLNYFPKDQVKIILFDDFKTDTKTIFDETISFLNLPPFNKYHFPKVNVNKSIKFKFVNSLISLEPKVFKEYRLRLKKIIGIEKVEFGAKIKKLNSDNKKRDPINNKIKEVVINNYRDEIFNLSKFLQKDLSSWNK